MPLYSVRRLLCAGNPVDGYEVNDTRDAGEVYIPPNGDALQAMVNARILRPAVIEMHERGEIQVLEDDSIQISETETCWAGDTGEEMRYLEMVPDGRRSPAFDRAVRAVEAQLEGGETLMEESGERPIYDLHSQVDFRGFLFPGSSFWKTVLTIPASGGNGTPDEHEIVVELTFDDGRIHGGARVRAYAGRNTDPVYYADGVTRGDTVDRFEWSLVEWQRRPTFGFDPLTSEELRPTKKQIEEIMVALDQAMERGPATPTPTSDAAPREVERRLQRAGIQFTRERTGGADWSVNAVWNLGHNVYLVEDGDVGDRHFALLRRDMSSETDEIEEIATGELNRLIDLARNNREDP